MSNLIIRRHHMFVASSFRRRHSLPSTFILTPQELSASSNQQLSTPSNHAQQLCRFILSDDALYGPTKNVHPDLHKFDDNSVWWNCNGLVQSLAMLVVHHHLNKIV